MHNKVVCAWGSLFEPIARKYFEKKHSVSVFGHTVSLNLAENDPLFGKITFSPDGYFLNSDNELVLLEFKCPFSTAAFFIKTTKISATFNTLNTQKSFFLLSTVIEYFILNKQIPLYTQAMEIKLVTLKEMGLRSTKAIAKHILQENTWENNLIPDIANVNYFKGHQGPTNLHPLEGLPVFVDDFYVFGRLRENKIVRVGRKTCITKLYHKFLSLFKKYRVMKMGSKTLQLLTQSM